VGTINTILDNHLKDLRKVKGATSRSTTCRDKKREKEEKMEKN